MLDIALEAAKLVKTMTVEAFYSAGKFDYKPDRSVVTETDIRVEEEIRELFAKRTPNTLVLGEEFGFEGEQKFSSGWVIDPIDGTRAFIYGVPLFSTLIAYVENGEPLLSVISFPAISTMFYASQGEGCWLESSGQSLRQLKLGEQSPKSLSEAVISASGIHSSHYNSSEGSQIYHLDTIVGEARDFIFANDAYQHAMVASGRIHGAIDTIMKPWDSAALIPCIREAGGEVCGLNGERTQAMFAGSLLSTATPELAEQIVELMAP
ncbi:histidinol-phosphate aminotransferase [Providencia rettgeri]|nr:histidinol-phosphate aminotransferase [Providencia rettgeri]ELQ1457595.1 histidinol-phosphate aminotransferase [Providencia rettgeri]ELR5187844.1 histidinol-phosphate aminotransferase [Providencia rettgeri]ELR5213466.1 histidinol-phosphate aminotransferase [Providencia rettgeri]EMB0752068.1 histidinol-phosphate aminotransferase [Providencia rettgeri]